MKFIMQERGQRPTEKGNGAPNKYLVIKECSSGTICGYWPSSGQIYSYDATDNGFAWRVWGKSNIGSTVNEVAGNILRGENGAPELLFDMFGVVDQGPNVEPSKTWVFYSKIYAKKSGSKSNPRDPMHCIEIDIDVQDLNGTSEYKSNIHIFFELWLYNELNRSSSSGSSLQDSLPKLQSKDLSWQWCGHSQDSFIINPPNFGFSPNTTVWTNKGTCDLTDADPVDPTASPRRPKKGSPGNNFIEAKTTGGNTITITERSHALIEAALKNNKGIWIMICTDWTATTDHFHPENIIVIGRETLKTAQLWNIASTPSGAAPSPAELCMENNSYTLKFPSNGAGRNFSLEQSNDHTLHFHRPHSGSITTTPPPREITYTYPDPTTGPHTTNLYIYD